MGTRKQRARQEPLWYRRELLQAPGGVTFHQRLDPNELEFERFCEERCRELYHEKLGHPSLASGTYVRLLMIGFLERLDSERRHRPPGGRFTHAAAVSAD